jgi:hypothetical protein
MKNKGTNVKMVAVCGKKCLHSCETRVQTGKNVTEKSIKELLDRHVQ